MAAVMVYSDPDEAIQRLDKLSPSQKSPLKLVVRAEARVHQSYTKGDVQLCEDALQDLDRVQFIVGRNLKNQVYRLFATTYALMCAKRDNRTLDQQRLTSEGSKVEEWLRVNYPQSVSTGIRDGSTCASLARERRPGMRFAGLASKAVPGVCLWPLIELSAVWTRAGPSGL